MLLRYLMSTICLTHGKINPASKTTYGANWHITKLEEKIFNSQTEIKSIDSVLGEYEKELPLIKARLANLDKTADVYKEIKRRIDLEYNNLKKIDIGVSGMKLALNSNATDLRIFEKAEPPVYPMVDTRRKKVIFGFILGLILAGAIAVILEIIDLTITLGVSLLDNNATAAI